MTLRREVPLGGDALAWVHSELAELKSKVSLAQSAAEQSRNLAADAADKANSLRSRVDQSETHVSALGHVQDELRLVRDHMARAAEDINALRQSRDEIERRVAAFAERERQERNDSGRRFAEIQRQVDAWHDRVGGYEDVNRRNLEAAAQLQLRVEALEGETKEADTRQARDHATISRVDQEATRLSAALGDLHREDDANRERVQSLAERLARFESEVEALKTQIGRINRIDDRLELVQAERSRHGERITELTLELGKVREVLNEYGERFSLIEVRIAGYTDELRTLEGRLTAVRDQIVTYLRGVTELETEFRRRTTAALEKEIRDIRTRGLSLGEE